MGTKLDDIDTDENPTETQMAVEKFILNDTAEVGSNDRSSIVSNLAHYRRVIALGLGWFFLFMAVITLRSLQSSMNHVDGLGLITMGTFYGGMMFGSFVSSAIVQTFGPKFTLVISSIIHVAFVAANIYPNLLLLATVGAIGGFSHSSLWAAQSTYLTALAKSHSRKLKGSFENILARYFGVLFLFAEVSMVVGNPLASFLLGFEERFRLPNSSADITVNIQNSLNKTDKFHQTFLSFDPNTLPNKSLMTPACGHHYCHSYNPDEGKMDISNRSRYVVVGTYTASATMALLIFIFFVEDKHLYVRRPGCSDISDKLLCTLQSLRDVKMILCIPFMIFFGFEMAFVYGDVVKAYISCPVGVSQVGNLMFFYGIVDAVSSLVFGWAKKFLGSLVIFTIIVLLNAGAFVALLLWNPDGGVWGYILFSVFGSIQGITNVHVNSQVGSIFRNNVESAFSLYRFCLGLGLSVGFAYSPYLCMKAKTWTTIAVCSISTMCFYALEVIHKRSTEQQQTVMG